MSARDDIFAIIGEGAALLARLHEDAPTFFDDLNRLREILAAVGETAPAPAPAPVAHRIAFSLADRAASAASLAAYVDDGGLAALPDVLIPYEAQTVAQLAALAHDGALSNRANGFAAANGKPLRDDESTKLAVLEHFKARGLSDAFTVEQHGFDRTTLAQSLDAYTTALNESVAGNPHYVETQASVDRDLKAYEARLGELFRTANDIGNRSITEMEAAAAEFTAMKARAKAFVAELNARNDAAFKQAVAERASRASALLGEQGHAIVSKVLESSAVTAEQASAWAAAQILDDDAAKALKKSGYPVEQFRQDMADFYRVTGGKGSIVRFKAVGSRANADGIETTTGEKTIGVSDNFCKRTLWHELGHHFENDPIAKAAANGFLVRRRESDKLYRLRDLTGSKFYGRREVAWKDSFTNPYVGRVYPDGATEVFSMGLEYLSDPARAAWFLAKDPEHFALVTGYMTGAATPAMRAKLDMHTSTIGAQVERQQAAENEFPEALAFFAGQVSLDQDNALSAVSPELAKDVARLIAAYSKNKAMPDYLGSWKGRYWVFTGTLKATDTKRFKSNGYLVIDTQPETRSVFLPHVVTHAGFDTVKALLWLTRTSNLREAWRHFFIDGNGRTAEEKLVSYQNAWKASGT